MLIDIHEAENADVDALTQLNRHVHDIHVAALPTHFRHAPPEAIAQLFRSRLETPATRVWVASIGKTAVGYAVSTLRERAENARWFPRRFWEIEEIAVAPAHRRHGVARALIERVVDAARSQGGLDVELTAWSFNTNAHAAFEALGFRPTMVRFKYDAKGS